MEYNKIISVTGLGGLFELIGSKADGAIVRSLEDKTTKFASSRSHHFSHLESIEVYTVRDNVNLVDIFKAMKSAGRPIPDYKDITAVKAYFTEVYPEMDFERVYTSDLKKMVRWYNILMDNEISLDSAALADQDSAEEVTPASSADETQAKAEQTPKAKTAKKAAVKKVKEPVTSVTDTANDKQAAPTKAKKKAAPKK